MSEAMTAEQFQEEFGEIMLNGLDSIGTYIPLRTNKKFGVNVALRPMVIRASKDAVLFGGKLRVGFTLDTSHHPVKTKVQDINPEVRIERLKDFCKGFKWQKTDERRFSTVVGFAIAASVYDGDKVLAHLEENPVAKDFIERLESTYKQYNDVGFTSNRRQAAQVLHAAWVLQSENVFKPLPQTTQLPADVVGKTSTLLNQAQDKYHDNVVSFSDKVKELASKASA